ncbi:hypothetical protein [Rhodanobacter sp. DHG33]|uniref:hypothetical protein n=1 Tax=Rhodanobacter sp. DHG33 TaxID=2775921 RepID=UPI001784B369|nr:hypothetical protein [Rhodanobacter sp. DHG33]MBD8898531.1 hypothetical protein [Rhodanobacter sp. DHG33]
MHKRFLMLLATMALCGSASASQTCYVNIINDGQDSVAAIDSSALNQTAWTPLDLGGVLQGGYAGQATVSFKTDQRRQYNLLVRFVDGRILEIVKVDVCRQRVLYIGRTWAHAIQHQKH